MAWAQKNGTNWTPMYRANGVKTNCKAKVCGSFSTKESAVAHAEECEAKALALVMVDRAWRDENPDPTADELSPSQKAKLTFKDTWDRYRSGVGRTVELATLEVYASHMKLRVLPAFGTKRPDAISKGAVSTWLSKMKNKDGHTAATIRSTLMAFSGVMTYAVDQEIRTDGLNPCHGQEVEQVVRGKREEEFVLTGAQVARLIAKLTTPGLKLATATMVGTGCRYEELAALRVGCLDAKRCTIFIERRVTWPTKNEERGHAGGAVEHRNTKSKGVRRFKIRPQLVQQLEQWIIDNGLKKGDLLFSHDLVVPPRLGVGYIDDSDVPELTPEFVATLGHVTGVNGYTYRHGTTSAAFSSRCKCVYCRTARVRYDRARRAAQGRVPAPRRTEDPHLRHSTYLAHFQRAVTASELAEELDWTPTPHCLRHTYITTLANSGTCSIPEVQRRAGHEDIKTTLGYVHPTTAADQAGADALGTEFDFDLEDAA